MQVRPGERGDAGAVVAAIFQAAQAFDENGFRFPRAGVADDAAHRLSSGNVDCQTKKCNLATCGLAMPNR